MRRTGDIQPVGLQAGDIEGIGGRPLYAGFGTFGNLRTAGRYGPQRSGQLIARFSAADPRDREWVTKRHGVPPV